MATFADRVLIYLSDPSNRAAFVNRMNLGAFFTADFQSRFNSEFWQIAQVAVGATRSVTFEAATWTETRMIGRQEHYGAAQQGKSTVDYRLYGPETAVWADAVLDIETTIQVDQFPGTVAAPSVALPTFRGLANLLTVLRIDAANHPLDHSAAPLAAVTLDAQGKLQTAGDNPTTLHIDPPAGALLRPDGSIYALALLELFPCVGPSIGLLGAPLGQDGQPLHDLRLDNRGVFTTLTGAAAAVDPASGLPLDGAGQPVRPARLAVPDGGNAQYRVTFALPIVSDRVTFSFVTHLYLFLMSGFDLVGDLRSVLGLRWRLQQRTDYMLSLNDMANKSPYVFALVYEDTVLSGSGLAQQDVRRLGSQAGVLVSFFAEP